MKMLEGTKQPLSKKNELLLLLSLIIISLSVRMILPTDAPNGWRDDELSNALVIDQKILEGDIRIYYPDASGHEGLYHWLQAISISVFGETSLGIRGVSILFGMLSIILLYYFSRDYLGWLLAAFAALVLSTSYWSLLISRIGERYVTAVVFALLTFLWITKGVKEDEKAHEGKDFFLAGIAGGFSFYSYFAARGIPLIVIGYMAYLFFFRRAIFKKCWKGLLITLAIMALLAAPLVVLLSTQPSAETRVSEIALPIKDAMNGDLSTLWHYASATLAMFTHDGDDEVLYNIPHRPIFSLIMGLLCWGGVVIAVVRAVVRKEDSTSGLLLLWFFAGIVPGMLSVPPASLSHTVLAQPPAYIFPALCLGWMMERVRGTSWQKAGTAISVGLIVVLAGWESYRGIRDFFVVWPKDDFNRLHHHSALHEASHFLNQVSNTRDLAIAGFMSERWDQQAIRIDLEDEWRVREFDPYNAFIFLDGDYSLYAVPDYLEDTWAVNTFLEASEAESHLYRLTGAIPANQPLVSFSDGLTLLDVQRGEVSPDKITYYSIWRADGDLDLPAFPLFAKPPAPGEDSSPRLRIFFHLLNHTGEWIAGADNLGVDPYTLLDGDIFIQRHEFVLEGLVSGCYTPALGLYNPISGERVLTLETDLDSYQPVIGGEAQLCIP